MIDYRSTADYQLGRALVLLEITERHLAAAPGKRPRFILEEIGRFLDEHCADRQRQPTRGQMEAVR